MDGLADRNVRPTRISYSFTVTTHSKQRGTKKKGDAQSAPPFFLNLNVQHADLQLEYIPKIEHRLEIKEAAALTANRYHYLGPDRYPLLGLPNAAQHHVMADLLRIGHDTGSGLLLGLGIVDISKEGHNLGRQLMVILDNDLEFVSDVHIFVVFAVDPVICLQMTS